MELLNLCHALMLVSLWEGSGRPALEVMERLGRERFLLRDLAAAGPGRAAGFLWDATAAQLTEVLRQ